ncbi:copine-9 isoform X2, partial [Tachysurus ichikawai]
MEASCHAVTTSHGESLFSFLSQAEHNLLYRCAGSKRKDVNTSSYLKSFLCAVIYRTEVIENTLNPDFVRKFVLDYFFEEKQNLRFDVYNVDSRSSNISKHSFLGQTFCTLGEIIGSSGARLERTLS